MGEHGCHGVSLVRLVSRGPLAGDTDRMVRGFLNTARAAVKSANDEASRKDAWQQLGEVESQLR